MKVIMVGGGTGGHIYPAIAIAQSIQELDIDSQILFIGSEDGIETTIVPKERFTLATIKAKKMLRKLTLQSLLSPFYALAAIKESLKIIRSFKPDIIIATGGFVSLPVIIAGFFSKVPILLHEGNVTPGLTTRICKWFVSRITVSFEVSRKYFKWRKVYCTGGPVRKEITKAVKGISIQNMGLRQDQKILLVIGGSQGARSLNKAVVEALPEMAGLNLQVLHVCGERDHAWVRDLAAGYSFYHLIPYMYNIWDGLAASNLVISRAGATAISEIIARSLPSILVPFPYSAEGHQDMNARLLGDAGAALVIKDKELNKSSILKAINEVLNDKERYQKMQEASKALGRPDAAKEIVSIIMNMLGIDIYARKRKKTKK